MKPASVHHNNTSELVIIDADAKGALELFGSENQSSDEPSAMLADVMVLDAANVLQSRSAETRPARTRSPWMRVWIFCAGVCLSLTVGLVFMYGGLRFRETAPSIALAKPPRVSSAPSSPGAAAEHPSAAADHAAPISAASPRDVAGNTPQSTPAAASASRPAVTVSANVSPRSAPTPPARTAAPPPRTAVPPTSTPATPTPTPAPVALTPAPVALTPAPSAATSARSAPITESPTTPATSVQNASSAAPETADATPAAPTTQLPSPRLLPRPANTSARPTAPQESASSAVTIPSDVRLIQSVLVKYFDAFSSLDAYAAKEVWPGVNDAALSRAFDSLDEQHFDTDDCQVTVNGDSANAVCGGTIKYVQKVGPKTMRVEKRQWKFDLRHTDGEWLIQNVQTR